MTADLYMHNDVQHDHLFNEEDCICFFDESVYFVLIIVLIFIIVPIC